MTPWVTYLLGALAEEAERARALMENAEPEKLLSGKQSAVYRLFEDTKELGAAEIRARLNGKVPLPMVKQALSRLVSLKLLEHIGQKRATRYRRAWSAG